MSRHMFVHMPSAVFHALTRGGAPEKWQQSRSQLGSERPGGGFGARSRCARTRWTVKLWRGLGVYHALGALRRISTTRHVAGMPRGRDPRATLRTCNGHEERRASPELPQHADQRNAPDHLSWRPPLKRGGWVALAAALGFCLMSSLPAQAKGPGDPLEALRSLAVQDGGRFKPFEVYARESLSYVTGRARNSKEDAVLVVLKWLRDPDGTKAEALLDVGHQGLREALGLPVPADETNTKMSLTDLSKNDTFWNVLRAAAGKEQAKEPLSPAERKAGELHTAFSRLGEIVGGHAPRIVAIPVGEEGSWQSVPQVTSLHTDGKYDHLALAYRGMLESLNTEDVGIKVGTFVETCRKIGAEHQPPLDVLEKEVHYYQFGPFGWAMYCYMGGALLLLVLWPVKARIISIGGGVILAAGCGLHAYGMVLRSLISGRAPVTNMYESVLWTSFCIVAFALLLAVIYRSRFYALMGGVVAWLALALAGYTSLDTRIEPLMPVLRSNFWLTVHVLTIVASYGAFALAAGIGHVGVVMGAFAPKRKAVLNAMTMYMYRALQIGVLLLTAGTILGGVWAAYSWGRFWGWDPKEVGALIALLTYLGILHCRYAGWWTDFGLSAGSVLGFQTVLLAWYGVNLIGKGLHSYGFSEGGLIALVSVVSAEVVFVLVCWMFVRRRNRAMLAAIAAANAAPPS